MIQNQAIQQETIRKTFVGYYRPTSRDGYASVPSANHIHGGLLIPMMDITKQRMAAEELARYRVLISLPQSGQLKKHALSNDFSE